jgi:hypothetical protein
MRIAAAKLHCTATVKRGVFAVIYPCARPRKSFRVHDIMKRATLLLAMLAFCNTTLRAAPECPVSITTPKPPENIVDWYDKYVKPSRTLAGIPESPAPTRGEIEAFVAGVKGFHNRIITDSLYFEPLVQQIAAAHADHGDFKALTSKSAQKIYRPGSGPDIDFSAVCIDTRRDRFPDDSYGITLFGVDFDNCRHITVRGLVFTSTTINGAANGECRADHTFYRMLIVPVFAGTNTVSFICNKDVGGCARR